jgi:hypothetical protein
MLSLAAIISCWQLQLTAFMCTIAGLALLLFGHLAGRKSLIAGEDVH